MTKKTVWLCWLRVILLGVLQQTSSVLSSGVVLGMAQPALSVVLHPVGAVAVAQQEVVGHLTSQQEIGTWSTKELELLASSRHQKKPSTLALRNCDSTVTGPPLTFVVSKRGAVVAEESVQHGFLWTSRLDGLLLHQPQETSSFIRPGQRTHLWWEVTASNTNSLFCHLTKPRHTKNECGV